jgi:glucan phosphoethanolaminetransferase (alkaline phosphatase superfamily)
MSDHPIKIHMNYIYFGLLFLAIATLQIYHVFLIPSSDLKVKMLYAAYAFLETFIEVLLLATVSTWLLSQKKKRLHFFFLCFICLLFLCRVADFAVVRLMDLSVWYWIGAVFQETFENFIEMLYATNMKLLSWFLAFLTAGIVVVLSTFLFYFMNHLSNKKPFFCSSKKMFGMVLLSALCLVSLDLVLYTMVGLDFSSEYAKALPWKRTMIASDENILVVDGFLNRADTGLPSLAQVDSNLLSLEKKPDLFLFVVESLREDFLTKDVTPTLFAFKQENYPFEKALSSANGTQLSWFSLFYSMYPFYWTQYQSKEWKQGSLPLSLLKKMGYKVHVYASSRLNYCSMDWVLFGEDKKLVDELYEYRSGEGFTTSETDKMAIDQLCKDIQSSSQKGGRIFITFLDATHFGYSWPKEKVPHFVPFEEEINYWELACNRANLEPVKNRYRNALNYIDDLFYSVEKTLKEKQMWDDAVVVFTADHGEEFNEYGSMFHASRLSSPQLQIPLYFKLGKEASHLKLNTQRKASQIDIFPTLFHYLRGDDAFSSFFHGQSLFDKEKKNYLLGARYNASHPPCEFYLQNDQYRLVLEFVNRMDIFHERWLKVNAILDEEGQKVPFSLSLIQSEFGNALKQLFSVE